MIAFADFVTPALAEHATVVFPAESNAEKEGTLTHPDGRMQRVRQAIGHQGEVRAGWAVLAELARRCGAGLDVRCAAHGHGAAGRAPCRSTPASTLEEIGGRGVRWQDRDAASKLPAAELPDAALEEPPELPEGLRLGAGALAVVRAGPASTRRRCASCSRPSARSWRRSTPSASAWPPATRCEVSAGDAERARHRGAAPGHAGRAACSSCAGTAEDNATALTNGVPRTVRGHAGPDAARGGHSDGGDHAGADRQGDRDLRLDPRRSCR